MHHSDGYFYMSATSRTAHEAMLPGTVLMRTNTLADWKSWQCWNGVDFSTSFVDPYAEPCPDPETLSQHVCQPIPSLNFTVLSIKYSTHFRAYIATGQGIYTFANGTRAVCFLYKLSTDDALLHWSAPQLIRRKINDGIRSENYPSLLDDAAPSRNFEEVGEVAWLYHTVQTRRANGTVCTVPPFCRDLYRQRIRFKATGGVNATVV